MKDQLMSLGLEGTMRLLWNIKSEREDVFNMDANKLFAMGNELFFEGDEECDISYADKKGKYQNQTGITLPRMKD